jgi:hypothetical protein
MDALKPAFADIEASLGAPGVVPAPGGNRPAALDLTGKLLEWLKADGETRALIRTLPQS